LAGGFVEEIPEIESGSRIALWNDINITYEEDSYMEKKFLLADSNFFEFFSFKLLQGDPHSVLSGPNKIVLTESAARKIFSYSGEGDNTPIGKLVNLGTGEWPVTVTGIVKDPPGNSHFHFNMILSMESWDESRNPMWISNNLLSYVKLEEGIAWKSVEAKLPDMVRKHVGPQVQMALGIDLDEFFAQGGKYGYYLQPLLDIHLRSTLDGELEPGGNINTLYLLTVIVLALILVACVNFMNLSTARYTRRAKEVGVRKALGGTRKFVMLQFLGESVLMCFISTLAALMILFLVIPQFNSVSGKMLIITQLFSPQYIGLMVLLALIIGIMAGSYPAFYLSSFKPLEVLSGKISAGLKSAGIRKGLVVFQFTISIGLITSTLLIYKQLVFLQNQDLGFDKENVLVVNNADALGTQKKAFKDQIQNISGVVGSSVSTMAPPNVVWSDVFHPIKENSSDNAFHYFFADEDYAEVMNIELVAGRFFSEDYPSDSTAIVINEAAARLIGWENAVGEKMRTYRNQDGSDVRHIVGVVKDYNFQSLKDEITSLVIFNGSQGKLLSIKLAPGKILSQVDLIESTWKELVPGVPFEFSFIDDSFDAAFRQEQRLGKIFMIFTGLAILVACLGLFGLATFTSEQRAKEIGIRKTLGSSSFGIVSLLSREYIKLIILAFLIASPLSYFMMSKWLMGFTYQTSLGVTIFIAGGLAGLIIAILSVGYQSFRAANRDPVKSLKYE
jgi:putative ABC transport system permease protein